MRSGSLPRIERSVWLPADPSAVWNHLTRGELLSTWFGGESEIRPRPGGHVRVHSGPGDPLRWGTVEEVVDHQRIQWSWRTGDGDPSLVEIELEAEDGGTRLVVTETLLDYEIVEMPSIDARFGARFPARRRRASITSRLVAR